MGPGSTDVVILPEPRWGSNDCARAGDAIAVARTVAMASVRMTFFPSIPPSSASTSVPLLHARLHLAQGRGRGAAIADLHRNPIEASGKCSAAQRLGRGPQRSRHRYGQRRTAYLLRNNEIDN